MLEKKWQVKAIGSGGYRSIIKKYWLKTSAEKRANRGNIFFRSIGWDEDPIAIKYIVERIDDTGNSN